MNCFPFQLSSPSANDHSTILDYLPRLGYIFPNSESIMARAGISPACFLFICIVTPLLHVVAVQRHVTREIVCEQVAIFASFANSEIRGGAKRKKKKRKKKGWTGTKHDGKIRRSKNCDFSWIELSIKAPAWAPFENRLLEHTLNLTFSATAHIRRIVSTRIVPIYVSCASLCANKFVTHCVYPL